MAAMEKNNKNLNVPNLRFPEFSGEWEKEFLGTTCNVLMCKRILASQTNAECGVPFYKIGTIGGAPDAYISKELFESYRAKYNYPRKGEVMITCAGTVGKAMIFDGEDSYYQDSNIVWIDNPTNKIDNTFLYHLISKVDWSKLNTTTIVRIYNDDLRQLRISYPTLSEQRKISIFLSLLNQRIETQRKIIEDLKKLKDAITHFHFRNELMHSPMTYIGQYITQVSIRNKDTKIDRVLSVSNKYGFVDQDEQFEDRVVASIDTSNYKVVQKGDFAYNPARINVGSVARLQEFENGIVSPMYVCFTTNKELLPAYFELYLSTNIFKHEMKKRLEGSVRLCLTYESLCKIKIALPEFSVQTDLASNVSALLTKIKNEERLLCLYHDFKQYLLTQMFI